MNLRYLITIMFLCVFLQNGRCAPPTCTRTLNSGAVTTIVNNGEVVCVPSGSTFWGSIRVLAGGTIVICKSSFRGALTIDPAWHIYPAGRWYDSPSTSYSGSISNRGIRSRSVSNCVSCSAPNKGTLTTPSTICAGSSTSITGSNVAGANYQWRIRPSGGVWADFGSNSKNLSSTGNLTSTTEFARRTYSCTPRQNSSWNFVTVTVNPLPSLVVANPAAVCSPNTVDITTSTVQTTNTGTTTEYYTTQALADAGAGSDVVTPSAVGAGTYYIRSEFATGCYVTEAVTVTVNPLPSLVVANPAVVCSPNTVDISTSTVQTTNTGTTTEYYTTQALADAGAGSDVVTPSAVGAGTYYIRSEFATGCYVTEAVTVTVNPLPSLVVANPAVVCSPNTVDISTSTVQTTNTGTTTEYYTTQSLADAGAGSDVGTPSAVGAGTYYIRSEFATGCYVTEAVTVTVNLLPSIKTVGTNPTSCGGSDGLITVSGLLASTTYTQTYYTDLTPIVQGPTSVTTDASGEYTIIGLSAGGYVDIYVDSLGCESNRVSVTLSDPSKPSIAVTTNEPTCAVNDGIITISGLANGSSYEVSYNTPEVVGPSSMIANASGDIVITGLAGGTYSNVSVDSSNCVDSDAGPFVLVDPTIIALNVTPTDPTCVGGDGTLFISGLDASVVGLYTYSLDGGTTDVAFTTDVSGAFTIINQRAGAYTLQVDSAGCTTNIEIGDLVAPTILPISLLATDPTCYNDDGSITISGLESEVTGVYSYSTDGGTTNTSFNTDISGEYTITGLDQGTFTVQVDSTTCTTNTSSLTLTDPSILPITLAGTEPTCGNDDGSITIEGLESGVIGVYSYSTDGGTTNTSFTTDINGEYTITGLDQGTFTVQVDSTTCTTNTPSITLIDPTSPVITSAYLDPTCSFDDGLITVSGLLANTTYTNTYYTDLTSSVQGPTSVTTDVGGEYRITGLASGTYSDIYVDSLGCLSNRLTEVLRDPIPPSIEVTYKDPDCVKDNGEVYIHGLSNGYEYTFFSEGTTKIAPVTPVNGTPSNDTVQFIGISAGTITSITVDSLGCRDTFDVGFELVNPLNPTITVEGRSPSKCDGADGALVIKGVSVGFDYLVSLDSAGTTFYDNISEEALFLPGELLIENLYEGEYNNIRVDSLGCVSNLLSSTLVDPLMPSISASLLGRDSICMGWDTELQLVLGFIDPDVSWKWQYNNHSNGSGFSDLPEFDGDLTPKHIPDSTGEYRSVVTYGFCKDTTSTLFVEVQPNFTPRVRIAADASHLCEDDQFIFRVVEDNVRDSLGLHSFYQWNTGGERIHGAIRSDYYLENSQYPKTGDHFVALMTPDPGPYSFLCTTSTTAFSNVVEIRVDRLPEVGVLDVNATEICFQEEFRANLSQYRGRLKWMVSSDNMNWDTLALETSDLFDMVPSKYLQLVDNKEPAVLYYKVQVDLENLCAAQYSRVREIIEYPKLDGHIDIIQDCDYVSLGSSVEDNKYGIVEIHANADSRHTIFDKWYESENNLDYFPNEEGETIVLEDVEIKDLWYIAEFTNGIGCVHTDSVSVNNCPIPLVDIPTAITDNDDGANETFFVDKLRFYPENALRIYNKWGTMVYEKVGYDNEWEAIVDGEELPIGTYYYVLDLNNKENTSYQGYVTVVRP